MNAYLTGRHASLAVNQVSVVHAFHMLATLFIMLSSVMFVHCYLERNHSIQITMADYSGSSHLFTLKAFIIAGGFTLTSVLLIIFFQKRQQSFPIGAVLTSLFLTAVNFYFACKCHILEFSLAKLKRHEHKFEITFPILRFPANIERYLLRSNQVNVIANP